MSDTDSADKRTERLTVSVEQDFKQFLRIEAAKREMTMSELAYTILHEELDDPENLELPDDLEQSTQTT